MSLVPVAQHSLFNHGGQLIFVVSADNTPKQQVVFFKLLDRKYIYLVHTINFPKLDFYFVIDNDFSCKSRYRKQWNGSVAY